MVNRLKKVQKLSKKPPMYTVLVQYISEWPLKGEEDSLWRKKIRLTESNAKCCHLNLPLKGLCGRCLSV
jgi:hypothetical protein